MGIKFQVWHGFNDTKLRVEALKELLKIVVKVPEFPVYGEGTDKPCGRAVRCACKLESFLYTMSITQNTFINCGRKDILKAAIKQVRRMKRIRPSLCCGFVSKSKPTSFGADYRLLEHFLAPNGRREEEAGGLCC